MGNDILSEAYESAVTISPCGSTRNFSDEAFARVCEKYDLTHEQTIHIYRTAKRMYEQAKCTGNTLLKKVLYKECRGCDR